MISFNIHDKFSFSLIGQQNKELESYLEGEIGYFKSPVTLPDMEIELVDKISGEKNPLFPFYSKDSTSFYMSDFQGNKIGIAQENTNFRVISELKIDGAFLLREIIEPLMFYSLLMNGEYTFLHSSAVSKDGKAAIFCAWPHTGKTNMVISLSLNGYSFLSDEASLISKEGNIYPYPRPISAFYYNFEEFPELINIVTKKTTDKQKIRFKSFFSKIQYEINAKYLRKSILKSPINYALSMVDLHRGVKVDPENLTDVGNHSKIDKLFLLMTDGNSNKVNIEKIKNKRNLSKALSASWLWEREISTRHYLAYLFAFPERRTETMENSLELQSEIILNALRNVECFKVMMPKKAPLKQSFQELKNYL